MQRVPSIVLVGRMNVGKSTLFNRLASNVKSITLDYPGVTRDVLRDTVSWQGKSFEVVDTGGLTFQRKKHTAMQELVQAKALEAVDAAHGVIIVVDGSVGLLPEDRTIIRAIQERTKPLLIAINKSDILHTKELQYEFISCGDYPRVEISAEHGKGIGELLEWCAALVQTTPPELVPTYQYRAMILGKPNVGKSSLMNMLLKCERSIVCDEPGTTREAVSEVIALSKEHLLMSDTPGLRRKSTVHEPIEKEMVHSSLQALDETDIVLLVIDGSSGDVVDQELKLGFYALRERYKALILLVNKSDIISDDAREGLAQRAGEYRHLLRKVPTLTISCVTGKNVGRVLPLVKSVWDRHRQELPTLEVYRLFQEALERRPLIRNRQKLEVLEVRQLAASPITLGLKVNEPAWFGPTQCTFFENILRKKYDLLGVPIKFIVRKRLSRD